MNNLLVILGAALVPLIVGSIWYNPKVLGTAWMKSANLNEEQLKNGAKMPLLFGLCLLFSAMLAASLPMLVIHQFHMPSILMNEPGFLTDANAASKLDLTSFMDKYGSNFRTFKHGALHGVLGALFFALPLIAINSFFERRGAKYIPIHAGYWVISLGIMGGIVCQWFEL